MTINGISIDQSNAGLAKSRIHSWKKFGLRSSPFDNSFKCNYGSRIEHFQAILNKLDSFCHAHENIAVMTGVSGVGKTLMFHDFMKEHSEQFCKIEISADFSSVSILNAISSSLNLNLMVVGSNQSSYILQIVHAILRQETKFVLVCDDSHKLSDTSFNTIIELLTNIELYSYIKVIIFGNPNIFERIIKYAVCKGSGIRLQHFIMHALSEEQLKSYLHNCLAKSGWPGALPEIPSTVIHDIFQESEGVPRRVNIVAEKILPSYLPVETQDSTIEYIEEYSATKESIPNTNKKYGYLRKTAYAWQNNATTIVISLGFVIMLYGSYIWGNEMLTNSYQNIAKSSKSNEPMLAKTRPPKLSSQEHDTLLERINQSLDNKTQQTINSYYKVQDTHANNQNKTLKNNISKNIKPAIENLSGYTIQLSASGNLNALIAFKKQQNLEESMYIYKTSRQNKPWYVLVYGSFITKKAATDTLKQLQQTKQFKGIWIKSFLDIHLASNSYIRTP
jgi:type II secretory pathway predicted ATPase ExeA